MRNDERGFTLPEMLIAFSIFLLITSFIPLFMKVMFINSEQKRGLNKMEWEVFLQQIKMELRESKAITINEGKIHFGKYNGETVTFEKYNTSIRRQVNSRGHEILLQNIKELKFSSAGNGFSLEVVDGADQSFSARISRLIPLGGYP